MDFIANRDFVKKSESACSCTFGSMGRVSLFVSQPFTGHEEPEVKVKTKEMKEGSMEHVKRAELLEGACDKCESGL